MAHDSPIFTRAFCLLILAHSLQALGFSSMLLLPLYLDYLHASRTEIGTLMALAAVGGLASRPVVAWALDSWGRKPTILIGTVFLVCGMGLMGFVTDLGPLVYVNRILIGIGAGTLFTAYFTWASDMVPRSRRTEGIALFGISGLVPLGLNAFALDAGIAAPDLRLLFPALGGLIVLSVLCLIPLREPKRDPTPNEGEAAGLKGVLRALAERRLWPVWLATAVFAGLVGVFMAFVTVTAQARGVADPANLWLAYAVGAVGVRLIGAKLPDRVGPSNLIAPALALYLGAMLIASSATTGHAFVLSGLLAGLGHGYCFPVLISQAVSRSPDRWRGSAMSMFTAIWGLTEFLLPPAFGAISDSGGDALMYVVATFCALAGLVVWCGLEHRSLSPQSAPTPRRSSAPGPSRSGG